MNCKKLFPCMLFACLVASLSLPTVGAQTITGRPRQVASATMGGGVSLLENDPVIISLADAADVEDLASQPMPAPRVAHFLRFDRLLSSAIDARLGARYVWGAAGPRVFDCSGFVWSAFQSIGVNFERGNARDLWQRFTPATSKEESQFGTLVFFNNLRHVGIVADAHGFYHASRHHGVTYSHFNDYWASRIDGFRRVPVPVAQQVTE